MTLIELLIAITLVSLLSVGMLFAMRVGLQGMERVQQNTVDTRRMIGAQRILEQQLANLMPVTAEFRENAAQPVGRKVPYFQGEPQSMRFVSTYSLNEGHRGFARSLELQVVPTENGEGVRLIVNELPYLGPRVLGTAIRAAIREPSLGGALRLEFGPILPHPGSFVLADQLAGCRFSYLVQLLPNRPPEWRPVSVGLPRAIRVEWQGLGSVPTRLPWLSATAPVRILRNPEWQYVDE